MNTLRGTSDRLARGLQCLVYDKGVLGWKIIRNPQVSSGPFWVFLRIKSEEWTSVFHIGYQYVLHFRPDLALLEDTMRSQVLPGALDGIDHYSSIISDSRISSRSGLSKSE